ncbi:MAG: 50S ribosomal protein L9 [candidate division NC10 bacterium]
MKVILMQKVERLGEPGQQVEVADGYARNYLLPKQLAVPATPGHVKSLAQLTAQSKNREERAKREAAALAERLAAVQVTLGRRASEEEAAGPGDAAAPVAPAADAPRPGGVARPARLFGSVTAQDISEALSAQGLTVDKKQILLAEPIKTLGAHRVPVCLHAEVVADLTVTVEREA